MEINTKIEQERHRLLYLGWCLAPFLPLLYFFLMILPPRCDEASPKLSKQALRLRRLAKSLWVAVPLLIFGLSLRFHALEMETHSDLFWLGNGITYTIGGLFLMAIPFSLYHLCSMRR
ncbi:hypothetical protein AB6D11_00515 [Vibrio splendidus]